MIKSVLISSTIAVFGTAMLPVSNQTTNQNTIALSDLPNNFQAENYKASFEIGSSLANKNEEDYNLTYHSGIKDWNTFANVYHYFGYNGQTALATDWYYGTILLQDKHNGTSNSMFNLSSTVPNNPTYSSNPQILSDVLFKTSWSYWAWQISWCQSTLKMFGTYYNASNGDLHFVINTEVENQSIYKSGVCEGHGTTKWTLNPGPYALFWK